jgi:hypothetical protein
MAEKQAEISMISAGKYFGNFEFWACGRSKLSAYCCSAVLRSSIAKPPPFLGVSSLNLAAPRSGHFFCAVLLRPECVARPLMGPKAHIAAALLLRPQKSWRKISG